MTRRRDLWPANIGPVRRLVYSLMLAMQQALHMTCRQFIQRASEKYERPLGPWERLRQAAHRALCEICRIHEQRMDKLRALTQEIARAAPDQPAGDVHLDAEAKARIRAAMDKAAKR